MDNGKAGAAANVAKDSSLNTSALYSGLYVAITSDDLFEMDRLLAPEKRKRAAKSKIDGVTNNALCMALDVVIEHKPKHLMMIGSLLRAGATPDVKKIYTHTGVLHQAIVCGRDHLAIRLIDAGASITLPSEITGSAALHLAARGNQTKIVDAVLTAARERHIFQTVVNAKNKAKDTPLHEAVTSGNVEVVRKLIAAGANIHTQNFLSKFPCDIASEKADPFSPRLSGDAPKENYSAILGLLNERHNEIQRAESAAQAVAAMELDAAAAARPESPPAHLVAAGDPAHPPALRHPSRGTGGWAASSAPDRTGPETGAGRRWDR